jgi:hypothetical protein
MSLPQADAGICLKQRVETKSLMAQNESLGRTRDPLSLEDDDDDVEVKIECPMGYVDGISNRNRRKQLENEANPGGEDIISSTIASFITQDSWVLVSLVGISVFMVFVSLILVFGFQYSIEPVGATSLPEQSCQRFEDESSNMTSYNHLLVQNTERHISPIPVWQSILERQISVLQNLIHASLLGAAALVTVFRGDVYWFLFVRAFCFYSIPVFLSYAVHDAIIIANESGDVLLVLRGGLSIFMLLFSMVAFLRLEPIRHRICEVIGRRYRSVAPARRRTGLDAEGGIFFPPNSYEQIAAPEDPGDKEIRCPAGLAANQTAHVCANILEMCTWVMQWSSLFYSVATFGLWWASRSQCGESPASLDGVLDSGALFVPFEKAYGTAAHEAALLAVLMNAVTFPGDGSCVSGAGLIALWRVIVDVAALHQIALSWPISEPGSPFNTLLTNRKVWGMLHTSLDLLVMIPVLVTSIYLLYIMRQNRQSRDRQLDAAELPKPERLNSDARINEGSTNDQCLTLRHIVVSSRYDRMQRWGAMLLYLGTIVLLLEMSVECILLTFRYSMDSVATHDTWRWGMHVCAMYIFVAVMAVETNGIYQQTRILLLLASPMGSLVALWQIRTLLHSRDDTQPQDSTGSFVCVMFAVRAICGLVQTTGLALLHSLKPCWEQAQHGTEASGIYADRIEARRRLARFILERVYLPSFGVFLGTTAFFRSGCKVPMISAAFPASDVESCDVSSTTFPIARNWPEFGLVFHFGLLTVIFSSVGIYGNALGKYYKPSPAIASIFAWHLSLLISASLIHDFVSANGLSTASMCQRLALVVLLFASASLALVTHNHWVERSRSDGNNASAQGT